METSLDHSWKTKVSPKRLRSRFISSITKLASKSKEEDFNLIIITGQGSIETGNISIGAKGSKDTPLQLKPKDVLAVVGRIKGTVVLLIDACYSSHWVVAAEHERDKTGGDQWRPKEFKIVARCDTESTGQGFFMECTLRKGGGWVTNFFAEVAFTEHDQYFFYFPKNLEDAKRPGVSKLEKPRPIGERGLFKIPCLRRLWERPHRDPAVTTKPTSTQAGTETGRPRIAVEHTGMLFGPELPGPLRINRLAPPAPMTEKQQQKQAEMLKSLQSTTASQISPFNSRSFANQSVESNSTFRTYTTRVPTQPLQCPNENLFKRTRVNALLKNDKEALRRLLFMVQARLAIFEKAERFAKLLGCSLPKTHRYLNPEESEFNKNNDWFLRQFSVAERNDTPCWIVVKRLLIIALVEKGVRIPSKLQLGLYGGHAFNQQGKMGIGKGR